MEHPLHEVEEEILIRLNVRDLIRCKSVCKSWSSLISDRRFIRAHLNHNHLRDRDNAEVRHRRIIISTYTDYSQYRQYSFSFRLFNLNDHYLAGSCNGLVCISNRFSEVVIFNPSTREIKKVPNPQISNKCTSFCWGFGYDSIKDDYKIVLGFEKVKIGTCFQIFSLRSKVWKVIGTVNYVSISRYGILCKGMLHWVANDILSKEKVVLSFNITDEKFQRIPQPDIEHIQRFDNRQLYFSTFRSSVCLGIMEDCLCLFRSSFRPRRICVLKNYDKMKPWEIIEHACEIMHEEREESNEIIHDVVHCVNPWTTYNGNERPECYETFDCHCREYLGAPLFVESLVSPHSFETE